MFWNYIILLVSAFHFFSCGKVQKSKEQKTEISLPPPITCQALPPFITLPDTCSKPLILTIPQKGTNFYTLLTNDGPQTLKLSPPDIKPLIRGEDGGFSFMQNFNTEQGLALSTVVSGYKDRNGNLWFGTSGGGVSRYDGKSFTNYNAGQGLANNIVTSIIEDKMGNMWFGTNGGGASRYDGKSFTNLTAEQGLINNRVLSIIEDSIGNIWFSTMGGISKYAPYKLNGLVVNASIDGRKAFTNYTVAQGLLSNMVSVSLIDKKGNLWFGTDKGVSMYAAELPSASLKEKKTNPRKMLSGDASEQSKAYNYSCLRHSDSGISAEALFTNYTTDQGLISNNISSIFEDDAGKIWFGTFGGGVSKYSPAAESQPMNNSTYKTKTGFANYTNANGLAGNTVYLIRKGKNGTLLFITNNGVSKCTPSLMEASNSELFTDFTPANAMSNRDVRSITEDKTGTLWFGTGENGLNKYDGSAFTSFTKAQGLISGKIWSITQDNSDNLWFVGSTGLCKYDGKSFTHLFLGSITLSVRCIKKDKMGNIWFGSGLGVTKYDGKYFTNYNAIHGLGHNAVLSIAEDKTGNLWFGTYGGGVTKYDGNRVEAIEKGETIFTDNQHDLKKINGKFVKSFTNFTTAQGLAGNTVKCIIEDKIGNMWFGTNGNGISKYDGNRIDAIEGGDKNALLTMQGLQNVNGKLVKSFTNYSRGQGLPNNTIYSMLEDKTGTIWFGTAGGGLCRYDPNHEKLPTLRKVGGNQLTRSKAGDNADNRPSSSESGASIFITYTSAQGLADDNVYGIIEDTINNMIWLGTNLGLSGLKLNSLSQGSDGIKFENFNKKTGYPIKDVNTGSLFLDKKGIIWVGTSDKLVRFDYSSILKSAEPPVLFIQAVKIHGENIIWYNLKSEELKSAEMNEADSMAILNEEIITYGHTLSEIQRDAMRKEFCDIKFDSISRFYPIPQNLVLPYEHNNITFDFSAIETSRPFMVNYQYTLEGYDKEWSALTNKTTASFGNIHEGTYSFKLKAQSPDGIWSDPVIYKFKVLPPWFRTWWMYLIYTASGLFFIWAFIRWRERNLKLEKSILEEKVELRTKQLEEKNKIVEEQKKAVEERNTLITDSIEYAFNIQQAILPSAEEINQHFQNHFILYKPKDIVSGDFYWIYEDKEKVFIAVADCTGHGVSGAFMSLMGNNLLNEAVIFKANNSPSEILDELNIKIINTLKQNNKNTSAKYGMDIALIALNKKMRELEYAGAHNPLIIFRSNPIGDEHSECFQVKADKHSIGFIKKDGEKGFTNHKFKLVKGDMLYMFSDGYVDQIGGPEKKKMFAQPFRDLLQTIYKLELQEQKKILEETIIKWKGNIKQTDDILIVGIRL